MLDFKLTPHNDDGRKTSAAAKPKVSRVEVYWHTVKYRTVVLYAVVITAIVLIGRLPRFPGFLERCLAEDLGCCP